LVNSRQLLPIGFQLTPKCFQWPPGRRPPAAAAAAAAITSNFRVDFIAVYFPARVNV